MTLSDQHKKLRLMMKKSWDYKNKRYTFESFQFNHGLLTIATNEQWITVPADQVEDFFKNCSEVKGKTELAVINDENTPNAISIIDSEFRFPELQNIVMDNIKKLKGEGGKEYVQQAQAINGSVKQMIEMAKTKLLAASIIVKHKKH